MADFKTHITASTACGVAIGVAGYTLLDLPAPTCLLGAGLCSVAGMLPDLDSDSGVPVREMLSFGASAIPMMLVDRFRSIALNYEELVLAGAATYVVIRFGVGALLKKFTVHRGMFHSIPAMIIAFLAAYLLCHHGDLSMRLFKASAVAVGFFSHLLLDEIWSVRLSLTGPRVKKSFGTAMKVVGPSPAANSACLALLFALGTVAYQDFEQRADRPDMVEQQTPSGIDQAIEKIGSMIETMRR